MINWWTSITLIEKIYWCIAIVFSIALIIQLIFSFMNISEGEPDIDAGLPDTGVIDIHPDPENLVPILTEIPDPEEIEKCRESSQNIGIFRFRNLAAFFTILGWVGVAGTRAHIKPLATIIIGIILGFIAMVVMMILYYFVCKIKEDEYFITSGNIDGKSG